MSTTKRRSINTKPGEPGPTRKPRTPTVSPREASAVLAHIGALSDAVKPPADLAALVQAAFTAVTQETPETPWALEALTRGAPGLVLAVQMIAAGGDARAELAAIMMGSNA